MLIDRFHYSEGVRRGAIDKVASFINSERELFIVCIGTDRSTGDSLGPLVGANLKARGLVNVAGTLDEPLHFLNYEHETSRIYDGRNPFVIAIDAALGSKTSIGDVIIRNGPLLPGAGVGKDAPPIGDMRICGVVNVWGYMEYFVLQNTRLSLVMRMADVIADLVSEIIDTSGRAMSRLGVGA